LNATPFLTNGPFWLRNDPWRAGYFCGTCELAKTKAEKAHVAGDAIKDERFDSCEEAAYHH
jgi:hypothetical protein